MSSAPTCTDVPRSSAHCLYTNMTAQKHLPTNAKPELAQPLLVDVAHAARLLAISRSSLYQLIWTEQLTPVRIGRSVRFSITQLEQFVTDRLSTSQRSGTSPRGADGVGGS